MVEGVQQGPVLVGTFFMTPDMYCDCCRCLDKTSLCCCATHTNRPRFSSTWTVLRNNTGNPLGGLKLDPDADICNSVVQFI